MPPRRKETGETGGSASKRQMKCTTGNENSSRDGEDIISSLPNSVLHHILSFLDMKLVMQTSVLSKRWTDLWTSLRSLTFDTQVFYSPETERFDGFLNFVDQVLLLRDNSNIDTFRLKSLYQDCEIESRLNTWILSVIRSKVEKLYIDVWGDDGIRLPNRLFTYNSLTRLSLSMGGNSRWSITLPPDSSMCLPNLVILRLYSVSFHDENLTNKFFLSCPNLKRLVLDDVEFLHMNVNISCLNKLEDLTVENHGQDYGYCRWPDSKLELYAPNLKWFRCQDFISKDYILGNLPSLVKANIDMKVEEVYQISGLYSKLPVEKKQMYAQRMMQYLWALCYVEDLKLSAWFLEVISGSPDLLEGEPTELRDLTCLRLETWLSGDTIRAIAYLLKISPNIESLFLDISQPVSDNIRDCPEAVVPLHCLLDKLEIVEIQGAVGCANELNFLEVLLKNAKFLNKLVVCTSKEHSPDRQKRFKKFTEKLLMFPRASSNITILFL